MFNANTNIEVSDINDIVDEELGLGIERVLKDSIQELVDYSHKYTRIQNIKKAEEIIAIAENFEKELDDIGATFIHSKVEEISLSAMYVEPNLRKFNIKTQKQKIDLGYIKLWKLLDGKFGKVNDSKSEGDDKKVRLIILGEDNSSKTATCKRIFYRYYVLGYIPILVNGANVKNIRKDQFEKEIDELLKYQYGGLTLDRIKEREKVILIIDDFHKFGDSKKEEFVDVFVKNLNTISDHIVLVGDPIMQLKLMVTNNEIKDIYESYETYQILELGPSLRHQLVLNWFSLDKENPLVDTNELYRKYDESERHIESIIGKNYIPAHPFYILTILQTFESGLIQNQNYSIHGFYYEHIINQKIISTVQNRDDISLIYNYITELCFMFFEFKKKELSVDDFKAFHELYCIEYSIDVDSNRMLKYLQNAKLVEVKNFIKISYNYIYYFFIAKHLSNNLSKPQFRIIISNLCKKLHSSESGSIVMFLTHLSKDPFIISEIVENSKMLFNDSETLKLEDDIKHINSLVKEIPHQVIDLVQSTKDKREEELREKERMELLEKEYDESGQNDDEVGEESDGDHDIVTKTAMAIKTIEILGQLTKKYWGSMSGQDKFSLASETYLLGMRAMKSYTSYVGKNNESIIKYISNLIQRKHIKDKFGMKQAIEEAASDFVFRLCFLAMFGVIKRISQSIGYSNLAMTFEEILNKNNFTSTKLIDLAIRLDHFKRLPMNEIADLKENVKGNYLGMMVLRNLVIDHMYLFEIDYKDKQKICSLLGIEMRDQRYISATSVIKKE